MSDPRPTPLPGGLTVSYSGIRGILGESLTPDVARRFGAAFGAIVAARTSHARLLVARDTRPSGAELLDEVISGIGGDGWHILDLGTVATPTLQFCLEHFRADGGVIVTASHNPAQWNGFKFFLGSGSGSDSGSWWASRGQNTVLDHARTAQLLSLVLSGVDIAPGAAVITSAHEEAIRAHVDRVLAQVDVETIRRRAFRVALDSGRGAGHEAARMLLERLGCHVVDVQAERDSEPLPENLTQLREAVRDHACQLGFAQDLDADRLALVDETGRPAGEELTIVLVVDHVLSQRVAAARKPRPKEPRGWRFDPRPAVVVKNLSTTRAVDMVAERYGAQVVETRVGEVNLSRALALACADDRFAFGGEGNGGVIWPAVSFGRDSLVGMALVLEARACTPRGLSRMLRDLPHFYARKAKVPSGGRAALAPLFEQAASAFAGGRVDWIDGVRVCFQDGSWVGIRPSNTEPILRLTAESPAPNWADAAIGTLLRVVRGHASASA